MREREWRAFDQVVALLKQAREKGPRSRESAEAFYYLRRLWSIVLSDLQHPENELPEELRAGILSIGIWMIKEINQIDAGKQTDIAPMIEINEIIRDGLI